ncbi:ABC transporter transmembrane region [Musa troglodytarum]|uniref:ABC transporter transmembrane region n=1 Tax=Musa troglodytarum TaxID=320322 RepID=A0A9E7FYT0_9LILI|nr:ABC transporter transmembrane region [Musa troglodytarum]
MEACSLKKNLEVMPFGDQTVTGERRVNVSGGQKQRIQIARAIYHDADIYLFDDPFSAVDECLLGFLASRTVVYVIHQVEFLPSADFILFMKDGRIAEAGKHSEILNSEAKFMELVGAHMDDLVAHNMIERSCGTSSNSIKVDSSDSKFGPQITLKEGLDHEENEKSDQINQKGQIVQEEERERRKIWSTNYSKVCSNYRITLKSPTSDDLEPHVSGSLPIYVYVALAVGSFASYLISTLLLVHVRCKTATMLFSKMHTCIFWASLSFFDSTPSGHDQNVVDAYIPSLVASFAFSIKELLGIIAVMSHVAWLVFTVFDPVIATCIWYQQHYISTSRDIARLIGVCEAPVIQHFAETISGLISVGSFGQEKGFVDTNYNLTYDLSRLEFHSAATMQ